MCHSSGVNQSSLFQRYLSWQTDVWSPASLTWACRRLHEALAIERARPDPDRLTGAWLYCAIPLLLPVLATLSLLFDIGTQRMSRSEMSMHGPREH